MRIKNIIVIKLIMMEIDVNNEVKLMVLLIGWILLIKEIN